MEAILVCKKNVILNIVSYWKVFLHNFVTSNPQIRSKTEQSNLNFVMLEIASQKKDPNYRRNKLYTGYLYLQRIGLIVLMLTSLKTAKQSYNILFQSLFPQALQVKTAQMEDLYLRYRK